MRKTLWIYLLPVLTLPAAAKSAPNEDLATRVARLENSQSGQALSDMLDRIDRLQNEVQQLRGGIDEIRHVVDRVQDRQQSLYLDLDKRLLSLEGAASGPVPPKAPEPNTVENSRQPEIPDPPASESEIAPPVNRTEQDTSTGRTPVEDNLAQDTSTAKTPRSPKPGDEEKIYQEAFVYLNSGRYDDAIANFSRLIEAFPTGEFADNAQYWLGETFYVKREFDAARTNFSLVMEKYPASNKIPDAMLKLGYIEYELSSWKSARNTLTTLIQQYPTSNAAQLAQDRLNSMQKERH
ncbi:MAG: tol-pal system protein YbgF [Methylococcales bacterium]